MVANASIKPAKARPRILSKAAPKPKPAAAELARDWREGGYPCRHLMSRSEQRRRFKERETHPLKQWKLSPIDMASLDKWSDYTKVKEAMLFHTDTADAPWTVIKSDCKKRARLNALRYVLHKLPYTNQDVTQVDTLDTLLVGRAHIVCERGEKNAVLI